MLLTVPLNTPQKEYGYRNGQLLITASAGSGDQSLTLNGTSAYVQVPNSSSVNISSAITVEAWIKVNAIRLPIRTSSPVRVMASRNWWWL